MSPLDLVAGLAVAVGVAGVVVPLLPGTLLVAVAVVVWAAVLGEPAGWVCSGVVLVVLAVGAVVKYAVPGRRLRVQGVPARTLLAGAALGVVGFFVVPVLGLVLGFVLGVYLAELGRLGREAAWPATVSALRAVGLSLLIELVAAIVAAAVWLGFAVAT